MTSLLIFFRAESANFRLFVFRCSKGRRCRRHQIGVASHTAVPEGTAKWLVWLATPIMPLWGIALLPLSSLSGPLGLLPLSSPPWGIMLRTDKGARARNGKDKLSKLFRLSLTYLRSRVRDDAFLLTPLTRKLFTKTA